MIFFAFGRKRQGIGNFEKIFENVENFPSQNCEKCIILTYFSKKFNKPCVYFLRVWTKKQFIGNFEKIFEKFEKFLKKIAKNALF